MRCNTCGVEKPEEDFYRGFRQCKRCSIARVRAQQIANPERKRAASRRYYLRHADRLKAARRTEASREKWRSAYYRNKEKIALREKERAAKKREYYRARYASDPNYRLKSAEKAARRRGAVGGLSAAEWAIVCSLHGGSCAYCGSSERRLEIDHMIPLARGGKHVISNVVPACRPCNAAKGTFTIWEWCKGKPRIKRSDAKGLV